MTGSRGEFITVKEGRRSYDWRALLTFKGQVSLWFWLLGMFLDEQHKPSFSRIFLALWSFAGWAMIRHELHLSVHEIPLQNAAWTAWWAAEGVAWLAVFGPRVASYFGPGAAGAVAATAIGSAARDDVAKIMEQRAKADALPHDPDDPKTEYDE